MGRTKLCSRDEGDLEQLLRDLHDSLCNIGIDGAVISVNADGKIAATCHVSESTTNIDMSIEKDGDKVTKEYVYV